MNVSVAVNAVRWNVRIGEQRQHGAFLADHPADERVDADEQRELREVLAQAQTNRAARVSRSAIVTRGRGRWRSPSPRVRRRAQRRRRGLVRARSEARGHGAFAVPAHHRHGTGRNVVDCVEKRCRARC